MIRVGLFTLAALFACAQGSRLPEPTAPRVLLPAARVAEIAHSARWLETYAPYWDPGSDDLRRCEAALWRTHGGGNADAFGTYLVQYFGVTEGDEPRIAMFGVCAERSSRYVDEAARRLIGTFHGSACEFRAVCDPASGAITRFQVNPLDRS